MQLNNIDGDINDDDDDWVDLVTYLNPFLLDVRMVAAPTTIINPNREDNNHNIRVDTWILVLLGCWLGFGLGFGHE